MAARPSVNHSRISEHDDTHLAWLDAIKGISMAWIVLNHIAEKLFGYPYITGPDNNWPSLDVRLAQLQPLSGFGWLDVPFNFIRYTGWIGNYAVSVFVLVSGLALTYSLCLSAQRKVEASGLKYWGRYILKRFKRVYPSLWWAHLIFVVPLAVIGIRFSFTDTEFWLSLSGFRLTKSSLYYAAPAWWFVSLLLQLYLVFPLLYLFLKYAKPLVFMVTIIAIGLISRALGFWYLDDGIDFWSRGGVFITRIAEFATGMALGWWLAYRKSDCEQMLSSWRAMLSSAVLFVLGIVVSLTWVGMIFAPWLVGICAFVLFYRVFSRGRAGHNKRSFKFWELLGRWSLPIFIVHHPFVSVIVPEDIVPGETNLMLTSARIGVCLVAIAIATWGFEWSRGIAWKYITQLRSMNALQRSG